MYEPKKGRSDPAFLNSLGYLLLSSKSDAQTYEGDGRMEIIVRVVDREEAQDASSVYESEDGDEGVDDTEDDEVEAGIGLSGRNGE